MNVINSHGISFFYIFIEPKIETYFYLIKFSSIHFSSYFWIGNIRQGISYKIHLIKDI